MLLSLNDPDPLTKWLMNLDMGLLYWGFRAVRKYIPMQKVPFMYVTES